MSASMNSDSAYGSFGLFMETYLEPCKTTGIGGSFSIYENGVNLKFERTITPTIQYASGYAKNPLFITQRELIEKHSRWGANDVEFKLIADDSCAVAYTYSFDRVVLPNLLAQLPQGSYAITELGIYFDEEPAAKIISEVEEELIQFLRGLYIQSIQNLIK